MHSERTGREQYFNCSSLLQTTILLCVAGDLPVISPPQIITTSTVSGDNYLPAEITHAIKCFLNYLDFKGTENRQIIPVKCCPSPARFITTVLLSI